MDVTTSSTDEGVGSSCEIASCARTGAPPQGSIATKPVTEARNTIPINAAGLRPVNPTASRRGSMRMITILSGSDPISVTPFLTPNHKNDRLRLFLHHFPSYCLNFGRPSQCVAHPLRKEYNSDIKELCNWKGTHASFLFETGKACKPKTPWILKNLF